MLRIERHDVKIGHANRNQIPLDQYPARRGTAVSNLKATSREAQQSKYQMSWSQLCETTGVNYRHWRYMVMTLGIHPADALRAKTAKRVTKEMWARRGQYVMPKFHHGRSTYE